MKKIVFLSSVLLLSVTANAGLYRWVDNTGKVHYSDKMPVEASKKAHTELESNGLVKKNVDPEATTKQAAKKKQSLNQDQQEKELAEQKKSQEQQENTEKNRRDKFLLSTYEDEQELKHFFEKKLKLLKGNNRILNTQKIVLHKKILRLKNQRSKTNNQKRLKTLDRKIVHIEKNIKQYNKALEENAHELVAISTNYENDYKRFTELSK